MHSITHFAGTVSFVISMFILAVAAVVGGFATLGAAACSGADGYTRSGAIVDVPKEDIGVNYSFPLIMVGAAVIWALIGVGFRAL